MSDFADPKTSPKFFELAGAIFRVSESKRGVFAEIFDKESSTFKLTNAVADVLWSGSEISPSDLPSGIKNAIGKS